MNRRENRQNHWLSKCGSPDSTSRGVGPIFSVQKYARLKMSRILQATPLQIDKNTLSNLIVQPNLAPRNKTLAIHIHSRGRVSKSCRNLARFLDAPARAVTEDASTRRCYTKLYLLCISRVRRCSSSYHGYVLTLPRPRDGLMLFPKIQFRFLHPCIYFHSITECVYKYIYINTPCGGRQSVGKRKGSSMSAGEPLRHALLFGRV